MPDVSTLTIVAVASLGLAIVPGPAVVYIVTRSVTQGRAAGIASVAGIHAGTLVHVAAAVLGLSALLARSAVAFNTVKYAGAAYLVLLGISKLRLREEHPADVSVRDDDVPLGRVFTQGAVVNVLNPKTALFFVAFLPQFAAPGRGAAPFQMLVLGIVFIVVAAASDATYAVVSSQLGARIRSHAAFARRERLFSGGVYVALGVTAAFSGTRSSQ